MKYILGAFFLFIALGAEAYNPVEVVADKPYAEIVIPMDQEAQKQSYLGVLENFPHLYEFSLAETATLNIKTKQPVESDPEPVNLILLAVKSGNSIQEIVRSNAPVIDRSEVQNRQLAISTIDSEWLEVVLEPGLYRLEVSTPVNLGPYELDFGTETAEAGYFETFKAISRAQKHFGYSATRIFLSTYVLYQIGIVLVIGGIYYTWRRKKKIGELNQTPDVS